MSLKSMFKTLKSEVKNELNRVIDKKLNRSESSGESSIQKVDMSMVEGVLDLLGGGGGSNNMGNIMNVLQGAGGFLPTDIAKYLPGILKVAEIIGHGMGDDSPRFLFFF